MATKNEVKLAPVVKVEEKPVPVVKEKVEVKSEEYLSLETIFEEYKVRNPLKYEAKREEFARKLSALK